MFHHHVASTALFQQLWAILLFFHHVTFVIRTRYMLEEMEKANQNLYLSTYWINLTSAWMLSNTSEQDHNSSPCEHLPSGLL